MKAAVFKGVGLPLSIETRTDPVPGKGEIVLRVGYCGVCGTDLGMTDGTSQTFPIDSILGHEFSGEVVAIGAGAIAVTASSRRGEARSIEMGANAFVLPDKPEELPQAAAAALGGMPDVVVEAVGKKDLIAQALNCVRPAGTVIVLGFCSVPDSFIPAIAVWKEVKLQFSMTYSIQEFENVARVLDSGAIEPRLMVTDRISLNALPSVFEAMRHRTHQCKVLVNPWGQT